MEHPLALVGGGLRIAFDRVGDRYEHAIGLLSQAPQTAVAVPSATPLLVSLAGPTDDSWPLSPPFTGMHLERRPQGNVAFLVGLAGDSHWSASVELDVSSGTLRFDVACRAGSRPRWLGSTYRLLQTFNGEAAPEAPESSLRLAACFPIILEIDSSAGPARLLRPDAVSVAIEPVISPAMVFPATVRWRYLVRLGD